MRDLFERYFSRKIEWIERDWLFPVRRPRATARVLVPISRCWPQSFSKIRQNKYCSKWFCSMSVIYIWKRWRVTQRLEGIIYYDLVQIILLICVVNITIATIVLTTRRALPGTEKVSTHLCIILEHDTKQSRLWVMSEKIERNRNHKLTVK